MRETLPALVVADLRHSYGDRMALEGIGFALAPGELAVLLGPNGAGKTTLFSLITRLYDRQSGSISIFGRDPRLEPGAVLSAIGVVFQQRTLDLDLTVHQNLRYAAALQGLPRAMALARIAAEIAGVGLVGRRDERVRRLSGGEARRVEIARALLHRPRLLLCDEATAGLDIPGRQSILERVRALAEKDGVAILWATHLIDEVRSHDRVILLHRGRILADGPAERITEDTASGSIGAAFNLLTRETAT
ncbi:MAG TPA: ATP-binding cassette domain-containing protein [Sinorhizobium sp.]|nr:ATP-binding cassette domain-containing protein [Sinorhizobium sp.]